MLRRILGPAAATVLVAAAGVLSAPAGPAVAVPPPRAAAAGACGSTGVTAVVDFNGLGGNQETVGCDADGGGRAASVVFHDAGYTLSYSQAPGMNGFVCKIQGQPADGDCAQTDSYWSLWWTDGKSGRWKYSSEGASTLTVPDGGAVAFAWHEGSGEAEQPDVAAPVHASATPSSTGGSGGGSNGGVRHQGGSPSTPASPSSSTSATETSAATPSDSPTVKKRSGHHRHQARPEKNKHHRQTHVPTPTASSDPSTAPAAGDITAGPPADTTGGDSGSSFPVWLGVGIALVVLGAAVAVPVLRRRAG